MLKNTKSIYILKKLFTFIDERTKLDLIKYNKNIQNIINISLINYKFFSQRYIIFEKNGKGKEYNKNDSLIFEGEYLNGKRNGKGKEYYFGKLIFEGQYLKGKISPLKYSPSYFNNPLSYALPFPFLFPFKYSPSKSNSSLYPLYSFPFVLVSYIIYFPL